MNFFKRIKNAIKNLSSDPASLNILPNEGYSINKSATINGTDFWMSSYNERRVSVSFSEYSAYQACWTHWRRNK